MSLDFRPAGAPSSRPRQIFSHALTEASLIVRNGEQLLLALVIPLAILIGGRFFGAGLGWGLDALVPGVIGLAIWSSAFTTLAISTGFERRYHVLERLAATPLGKDGLLIGKASAIAILTLGQVSVLVGAAFVLGWRPHPTPGGLAVALIAIIPAMGAFAGLGLALAGSARPEATLAVSNLIYLAGASLGGLLLPLGSYPSWAQPVLWALPTGALGEALRSGSWPGLITLLVWCCGSLLLARKVFSWT
ncbi:MAG: ABC transporter permease [Arachnia sp.]